jgi:mannonate dehydratase
MIPSWRWYGPQDSVSLADVAQAGATGVVSALHQLPNGAVWTDQAIRQRQQEVRQQAGLSWEVIESIPVVEAIKQGLPDRDAHIEAYQQSLRAVGRAGIPVVTYNFMPVLDWTRTDLYHPLPNGAKALYYRQVAVAAFDLFALKRAGAETTHTPDMIERAGRYWQGLSASEQQQLTQTLLAGLPGAEAGYTVAQFREVIAPYQEMTADDYREHYRYFLKAVVPVAAEAGVKLAVHPDDPPYSTLGLPRIVSSQADLELIFSWEEHLANGLCFCTGSLGAGPANDCVAMFPQVAERVHFLHLRNVALTEEGDFYEAEHLGGRVDMAEMVSLILAEEARRGAQIFVRPDHGHLMLDDLTKQVNPGYSAIGRLKGLAELRGLEAGLRFARERMTS